jgi:hypothetical protein
MGKIDDNRPDVEWASQFLALLRAVALPSASDIFFFSIH